MKLIKHWGAALGGLLAGAINGLFGAGGGMVLVPTLEHWSSLESQEVFPASVAIILPICLISLALSFSQEGLPWRSALPYLLGSCIGGIFAGIWGKKIPTIWLHRSLGLLILWGGIRYIC